MCPSLHMSFVQYHELQYKVWFLKDKNRKRPFVIVDYLKTCDCCCCCFSYTDISVHFFSEFFRFLAHIQSLAAGRFNWKCDLSVAKIIWESLKARSRRFFKPQMYDFAQEKGKCLSRSASQPALSLRGKNAEWSGSLIWLARRIFQIKLRLNLL